MKIEMAHWNTIMNKPPLYAYQHWLSTLGCARGTSHVRENKPLQDRCRVASSIDGARLTGVVCDGAGSATHAEIGADVFCEAFSKLLLTLPQHELADDQQLVEKIASARADVLKDLTREGAPATDFNCTLAAVLLTEDSVLTLQIGDSPIVLHRSFRREAGNSATLPEHMVLEGENGTYLNETFFISPEDWRAHLFIRRFSLDEIDAVYLMSDGTGSILLESGAIYEPTMKRLVRVMDAMGAAQPGVNWLDKVLADPRTDPLTSDDKCLVMLVRSSHPGMVETPSLHSDIPPPQSPGLAYV